MDVLGKKALTCSQIGGGGVLEKFEVVEKAVTLGFWPISGEFEHEVEFLLGFFSFVASADVRNVAGFIFGNVVVV